tara:strand:+ start:203 stop:502 length:300 start_codon:yes stop_codon:yes gene_type:complete
MIKLPSVLPEPVRDNSLSEKAVWLAGEGAGSWFTIVQNENGQFYIQRHSPSGELECDGLFEFKEEFNVSELFKMGYPSHCATVTIIQKGEKVQLVSMKA